MSRYRRTAPILCALALSALAGWRAGPPAAQGRPADGAGPARSLRAPVAPQQSAPLPEPGGYRLARTYQSSPEVPLGVLEDPAGITVAADGTVFVTDRELHRAQRFEPDGTPLTAYGRAGDGPGDLYYPSGVAVDLARDRVYIGDTENDRVAIFRLDGSFEANWGPYEKPEALAVGPDGKVYIFEGETSAIRIRESDGTGDGLIEPGAFIRREPGIASGLAVGPDGNLYVAINLGVRKYSPEGDLLGSGAPKIYPSGAPLTRGVTFDERGRIYVLEDNRLRYEWTGGVALPVAVGVSVRAIAGGERGTIYLIVPKSRDLPAGVVVRRFQNGRQTDVRRWGIPQTVLGWLNQPLRLGLGPADDLYVVDDLRRVQRFGRDLLGATGQLVMPGMIEVAPIDEDSFVVARTRFGSSEDEGDPDAAPPGQQAARVERYDLGAPLAAEPPVFEDLRASWRHETLDDTVAGDASRVLGMAHDRATGRTWTIDAGKSRLTAYGDDGGIEQRIDLPELGAGFPAWSDVALAPDGSVLALHTAQRQLHRYDGRTGQPLGRIELPEFSWRVAVGPRGEIFLPTARRWVWRLDPAGAPSALWPLPEPAFGDPQPPSDIAAGEDGTVYLLDQASSAIYAFEPGEATLGDERPPAGRLRCAPEVASEALPGEVELGQAVTLTLRIGGRCAPHNRTGERPSLLLRGGEISLTLPAGLELLPGSVQPPPDRQSAGRLSWRLGEVPPAGAELRLAIRSQAPGRFDLPEAGGLRYLDGWFEFGSVELGRAVFHTLIPPTPTPEPRPSPPPVEPLSLPWLGRSAAAPGAGAHSGSRPDAPDPARQAREIARRPRSR